MGYDADHINAFWWAAFSRPSLCACFLFDALGVFLFPSFASKLNALYLLLRAQAQDDYTEPLLFACALFLGFSDLGENSR